MCASVLGNYPTSLVGNRILHVGGTESKGGYPTTTRTERGGYLWSVPGIGGWFEADLERDDRAYVSEHGQVPIGSKGVVHPKAGRLGRCSGW